MANGDAHFWTHQFADTGGTPYAGVKVYRYASGTSTLKNAWIDAGRTTVDENPSIGDSFGRVSFYGDGDYRLHVVTNDGVSLYDWDPVRITADTATMWENNLGTAYPAASTANQGQLFAKVDAFSQLVALGINDTGARFQDIGANLAASTYDNLPLSTAETAGSLRRVTDKVRGVWMDTGAQWVNMTGRTVNVREFGAVGDGTTNDSAAFQAAAEAVADWGSGRIYVPAGTYLLNGGVDTGFADLNQSNIGVVLGSNTHLQGEGPNVSILKSTRTDVIFFTVANRHQLSQTDQNICVSDLGFDRQIVSSSSGDGWNEAVYMRRVSYVWIQRCHYVGTTPDVSTGVKALHARACRYVWITDNYVRDANDNSIAVNREDSNPVRVHAYVARNICEHTGQYDRRYSAIVVTGDHTMVEGNYIVSSTLKPGGSWNRNAVEVGSAVDGVTISNNVVYGGQKIVTGSGSDLVIVNNRGYPAGISVFLPTDDSTSRGEEKNILIANNHLGGAGAAITVKGRAYPLAAGTYDSSRFPNPTGQIANVIIEGNIVRGDGSGTSQNPTNGVGFAYAHNVLIRGNNVSNCLQAGITVNVSYRAVVAGNFVSKCGLGGGTGDGQADGIFFENRSTGAVVGNVSYSHPRYGYYFYAPGSTETDPYGDGTDETGGVYFLDNIGWDNAGSWHSGLCPQQLAVSPYTNTTNPFPLVRMTAGSYATGLVPAGPGSMYIRTSTTDPDDMVWIKFSGTDENGWKALKTV